MDYLDNQVTSTLLVYANCRLSFSKIWHNCGERVPDEQGTGQKNTRHLGCFNLIFVDSEEESS